MTGSFGPWTTAIDSGSRAQLSAFWKKRLARLPGLRDVSPRISKTGSLLLFAIAVSAMGWPTLYLTQRVAAAADSGQSNEPAGEPEQESVQRKPQATIPGGPIVVPLPGGVTAELIGLCDHTAQDKTWWAPDGTPIAAPYQRFRSQAIPGPESVAREIAVQFHIPAGADATTHMNVAPCYAYSSGTPEDAQGKPLRHIKAAAITLPAANRTCTITLSVAAGEWTTMTETDGRHYSSRGERDHGYAFTTALETQNALVITISHDVLNRDVRIVAVDNSGKMIPNDGYGGGGSRGFRQTTGHFTGLRLDNISKFLLQARPFDRFEIRDVALSAGQRTQPTLVQLPPQVDN